MHSKTYHEKTDWQSGHRTFYKAHIKTCLLCLSCDLMMKVQDSETLSRQMLQALNAEHYSEHCSTPACHIENKGVKDSPESYLLAKSLAAVYHPPPGLHKHYRLI